MNNKKIYSNALWMIAEKSINIIGIIFINSYMAKYVGPDSFGKIAFSTSLFLLVQSFSWFGSQNVLFKRMSERKKTGIYLSYVTQVQRFFLFIISSLVALFYLYYFGDTLTLIFGIANCIATYFIVMDIYSIYNNSNLQSYINTITNVIGLSIALIIRYIIVELKLSLEWFVIPIIVIPLFPYLLRKIIFSISKQITLKKIKNKKIYYTYFFSTGGALLLSTLSIVLYTQISNIILAKFSSYRDLGIYSVAMTIGAAWVFIPQALITSYFSKIYSTKNKVAAYILLGQLNILIIVITTIAYCGFYFIGPFVISKLYGNDYLEATKIIPVVIFGTMFSAMGTVCYRYMIKLAGYRYLSIKMLLVACVSLPLSYFMIENYGLYGAVYTYLIIEFSSATLANYFFSKHEVLRLHLHTFKIFKQ